MCTTPTSRRVFIAATAAALIFSSSTNRTAHAATATDLVIRSTATSFRVGQDGTYTLSVTNNGPAATDDVIHVTTTLQDGLGFRSSRGIDWSCAATGQLVDCVRTTSLPLGSSSLVLVVSVCTAAFPAVTTSFRVQYAADTNSANNVATRSTLVKSGVCISTPTSTPAVGVPTATRTATRTPAPTQTPIPVTTDLSIIKSTVGSFIVGGNGMYNLTVQNVGPGNTNTAITVSDPLPTGLGFVSASGAGWSCTTAGSLVVCTHDAPLPAGSSTAISLIVSVNQSGYPGVTNTATLSYAGDTNAANNVSRRPTTFRIRLVRPGVNTPTSTVPGGSATPTRTPTPTTGPSAQTDLTLSKAAGGPFVIGSNGTYVLTLRNAGTAATAGPITITDTLPTGLTFVSADAPCQASGRTVTCVDSNPLAAGGARTIRLTLAIDAAAYPSITNSATVSYGGDTNSGNNTALRPTTVRR